MTLQFVHLRRLTQNSDLWLWLWLVSSHQGSFKHPGSKGTNKTVQQSSIENRIWQQVTASCSNIYSDAISMFTPEIWRCRCWCNTDRPHASQTSLPLKLPLPTAPIHHSQPHFGNSCTIWAHRTSIDTAPPPPTETSPPFLPALTGFKSAPYLCIYPETKRNPVSWIFTICCGGTP